MFPHALPVGESSAKLNVEVGREVGPFIVDYWWKKQSPGGPAGNPPGAAGKDAGPPRMPPRRAWLTFILLLLANYILMRSLFPERDAPVTVPYTVFKEQVAKGNVNAIYSQGGSIEGRFVTPIPWPPPRDDKAAPHGDR